MKLELNVKRFNNEDVIATSGLCQYSIESHFYYVGQPEVAIYDFQDGSFRYSTTQSVSSVGNPTTYGWYHYNGSTCTLCEDQGTDAHPCN